MSVGIALGRLTRLESEVFGKSCGVIVREKKSQDPLLTGGTSLFGRRLMPRGAHYVMVGLRESFSEKQAVPPDWQMTEAACKKIAVEYVEKLKKKGVA